MVSENLPVTRTANDLTWDTRAGGAQILNVGDLWKMAQIVVKSGTGPRNASVEQCFISMQCGVELGLKPFQALHLCPVVHGRPTLEGKAMLALILSRGDCQEPPECGMSGEGDQRFGWCRSWRRGWKQTRVTKFTWAQVQQAGLERPRGLNNVPSIYMKYGEDMMIWKAVERHANRNYPDVVMGIVTPMTADEIAYRVPMRDITPQPVAEMIPDEGSPGAASVDPLLLEGQSDEPLGLDSAENMLGEQDGNDGRELREEGEVETMAERIAQGEREEGEREARERVTATEVLKGQQERRDRAERPTPRKAARKKAAAKAPEPEPTPEPDLSDAEEDPLFGELEDLEGSL